MERNLEIKIKLTSDNTFDVEIYDPESSDLERVHCTDSAFANHETWQKENNKLAAEIRSWVDILRDYEEDEEHEKETFYVTIEKTAREHMTVEAVDLDSAVEQVQCYIENQDDDEFVYDFAICDSDGITLVDWEH